MWKEDEVQIHAGYRNSKMGRVSTPLIILSSVKMALFSINHKEILILAGIFPFQMCLKVGPPSELVKALYTDFTKDLPLFSSF